MGKGCEGETESMGLKKGETGKEKWKEGMKVVVEENREKRKME